MYTYPTNSEEEYISLHSFFSYILQEIKDFSVIMTKYTNHNKNSGKNMINVRSTLCYALSTTLKIALFPFFLC